MKSSTTSDEIWTEEIGGGPLIATAIHDGHDVRPEIAGHLELDEAVRLREEDPFTREWTVVAPTRIVGSRSRFEVDLNRPREKAVYRTPEDAWGLAVWRDGLPHGLFEQSLAEYDAFYRAMHTHLKRFEQDHGHFVVYDLHSYNHRRVGPDGPAANPDENPQVNIGTGTMRRQRWAPVVDTFVETLREFDFPGGRLDVRENVRFFGGNWPRWIHENFPDTGIALAIEVKKFFMDEWTGEPNRNLVDAIADALRFTVPGVLDALKRA
ncbi:N-formylglutamate amidohydrolase [Planctomycetota bacterium]